MTEKLLLIAGLTTLCMLSPGPDLVLVMRNTLVGSRRSGGLTALGILTGNAFHIGYCTLGLSLLLSRSTTAYETLRYASALYLTYLAWQNLRSRGDRLDGAESEGKANADNPYTQGLFNNVLNPKGGLFYLGVFSQVITPDIPPPDAMVLVATMMSVSALFWVGFVQTLHLPGIRSRLRRWSRLVDRIFGLLLLGLAVKVVLLE